MCTMNHPPMGLVRKRVSVSSQVELLLGHIFHLAQSRAERLALRQRRKVLRTDHRLDKQLGFTGAE